MTTPVGVDTAIFLTEYTLEGRLTRVTGFGSECLAGILPIIFGLFGFILYVTKLKFGWSILSGGLTLAFMILPAIIRTSEEAIKFGPQAYREVNISLGDIKWQPVSRVGLPSALPKFSRILILRSLGMKFSAALIQLAGANQVSFAV